MGVGKKYFWTRAEEARLVELWREGIRDFKVLGKELGRTSRAIEMKLTRRGVVEVERKISSTTTAVKSQALLTHEETLKILAGALEAFRELGLDNHPFSSAIELGICGVCGVHLECGGWGLNPQKLLFKKEVSSRKLLLF